jgi:hypothetical protein
MVTHVGSARPVANTAAARVCVIPRCWLPLLLLPPLLLLLLLLPAFRPHFIYLEYKIRLY